MEINIIVLTNKSAPTKCLLQFLLENCFLLILGFDRETLNFQLWDPTKMIGNRDLPPQGKFSNGPFF